MEQQGIERERALHGRGAADSNGASDRKVRVFVSYSRKDKEFAEALVAKLTARGFEPFLDTKEILPGEAWRERLSALILSADIVVFLISPDSVLPTSVCDWELNETERLGKRLLPVVCRKAPDEQVPSRLRRINWIDMTDADQAASRLDALALAILTDIGWIREHTRFGELADRWASKASREEHSLLRGKDIDDAELWISSQPRNAPEVTELQRTFIVESRRAEQRRAGEEREQLARTRRFQKRSAWALAAVAVLMLVGAAATAWQFHATSLRESHVLASVADKAFQDGYCDRALRYAVAGLPPRGSTPLMARNQELELALTRYASACRLAFAVSSPEIMLKSRSIGRAGELDRMLHKTRPVAVVFSADNALAATLLGDDTVRILNVADRRELSVIKQAGVAEVAFSPDARTLVTRAQDNALRVFDVATGHERAVLAVAGKRISAMAVSPDGMVALSGDDFVIRLWELATAREVLALPGHTKEVRKLVFRVDGRMLLSLSAERTAPRVWDARTGRQLGELVGHSDDVRDGAFSPDGTRIATASNDTTARIWDHSGTLLHTLRRHAGIVGHVTFSPDGLRIATGALDAPAGGRDSTVRIWDARTGDHLLLLPGHTGSIAGIAFSPDGKRILTASADQTARLWNAETGTELVLYKGHMDEIRHLAMAPDGKHFATASLDGTTRVWSADLDRGNVTVEGTLARPAEASFSSDGSRLVTVRQDNSAAVWDVRTGEALVQLQGHGKRIVSAAFSHDGQRLVTGSEDSTARVFDATSGTAISVLQGHRDSVKSVAFGPGSKQVLTVSEDKTARLWDAASGSGIKILRERNAEEVAQALFVPGSGEIMTAAYQEGVKVWTPSADQVSHRLQFPNPNSNPLLRERATEAIVSPDGRMTIVEWSFLPSTYVIYEGRQAVAQFRPGVADKPLFRFEANALKAIVGSFMSNTARIVNLTSSSEIKEIATLRGHTNIITGRAFSPDGRRIVTDSRDHTIRIWDANTGAEIVRLQDDRPRGAPPIFTPDGKRLVVQNPDTQRTVLLNLDPVNFVPVHARRDYICRERLVGAETFSDQEMEDPVLRTRDDLRNPCRVFGPFAIEYYTQMLGLSRQ